MLCASFGALIMTISFLCYYYVLTVIIAIYFRCVARASLCGDHVGCRVAMKNWMSLS